VRNPSPSYPGTAFGEAGEGHVRCCYATSEAELREALVRIERFVSVERAKRDGCTAAAGKSAARSANEAVIGIEIHCQLKDVSKMFLGLRHRIDGAAPEQPLLPGPCLGLRRVLPTKSISWRSNS